MSSNLVERVNNLSDSDAVSFLQYFNQSLLDGVTEEDFETLMKGIPEEIKSTPEFSEIDRLSLDEKASIEGEEAVALARDILVLLANNPRFSPLLEMAMDAYANIEHLELRATKEEILSGALIAAMIILAATSVTVSGQWPVVISQIPAVVTTEVLVTTFKQLNSSLDRYFRRGVRSQNQTGGEIPLNRSN
jgi:hypothetical protein